MAFLILIISLSQAGATITPISRLHNHGLERLGDAWIKFDGLSDYYGLNVNMYSFTDSSNRRIVQEAMLHTVGVEREYSFKITPIQSTPEDLPKAFDAQLQYLKEALTSYPDAQTLYEKTKANFDRVLRNFFILRDHSSLIDAFSFSIFGEPYADWGVTGIALIDPENNELVLLNMAGADD